jgi:hypothetical protein
MRLSCIGFSLCSSRKPDRVFPIKPVR